MSRIIHFEILSQDTARARQFYSQVFDWKFEDYSQYVNTEYWGVITGEEGTPGINGGLMKRDKPVSAENTSPRAFVCTVVVDQYDATHEKIVAAGGKVMTPKHALPGMAWQGYYSDPDGNEFGIHQPDENAQ